MGNGNHQCPHYIASESIRDLYFWLKQKTRWTILIRSFWQLALNRIKNFMLLIRESVECLDSSERPAIIEALGDAKKFGNIAMLFTRVSRGVQARKSGIKSLKKEIPFFQFPTNLFGIIIVNYLDCDVDYDCTSGFFPSQSMNRFFWKSLPQSNKVFAHN